MAYVSRGGPEWFNCGAPASEPFGNAHLCVECADRGADENTTSTVANAVGGRAEQRPRAARLDGYAESSFANDDRARDEWPAARREHDAWMGRKDGKKPWAPWTDPDAPARRRVCSFGEFAPCVRHIRRKPSPIEDPDRASSSPHSRRESGRHWSLPADFERPRFTIYSRL